MGGVFTLGGWGIGYLVGEGIIFTTPVIWWVNILKFFIQLPLLLICCGASIYLYGVPSHLSSTRLFVISSNYLSLF
jgi:hypothetical protein